MMWPIFFLFSRRQNLLNEGELLSISEYRDHTCFFHALTFAGSRGSCLTTRPLGRVFKHRPRDPAGVNAMKQTCVIVILAYFT